MKDIQEPNHLPLQFRDLKDHITPPAAPPVGFQRIFYQDGIFYNRTPSGLITRIENTNELYYGVKWTIGQSNPVITQVGKVELIAEMPLHAQMKAAVVKDDRSINYYLDRYQLSKKADGTPSVLTGADGQAMLIMPENFYFHTFDDVANNERYFLISPYALAGFTKRTRRMIGIYPGYLDATKLASISGVMPTSNRTPVQFLTDARARGTGWYPISYDIWMDIMIMYLIEFANFNFQATISAGVTNAASADWSAYNGYNPFVQNGEGDTESVLNGEIRVTIPNFVNLGDDPLNTQIAVFRQLRLLHGCYEWIAGLNIHNSIANGSRAFVCHDPTKFAYDTEADHEMKGNLIETDGDVTEWLPGQILPKAVGGSSTTHKCDYGYTYYDNDPASGWRAVLAFGAAYDDGTAGLGFSISSSSSGIAIASAVSRLCGDVIS